MWLISVNELCENEDEDENENCGCAWRRRTSA